jgi:hypothetical protein
MTQGIAPKPRENAITNAWRAKNKASNKLLSTRGTNNM